jgi:HD-like signal output (HDOD) protein
MMAEREIHAQIVQDFRSGRLVLPSLPEVLLRIREILMDDGRSMSDIGRAVQLDQGLAGRLVQIANSPLFRTADPIDSCQSAITRLGLTATRNLATSLALKGAYRGGTPQSARLFNQAWLESCRVAAFSQVLASVTPGLRSDRAMLAGLIHNIGVIPLLRYLERSPALIADRAMVERYLRRFQGWLGTAMLRHWQFDEDLQAIPGALEDWHYDSGTPRPGYVDIVLVARAHSLLGQPAAADFTPEMLGRMPAFRKLPVHRLGPGGSLEVIEESRREVERIIGLLRGEG